MSTELLQERQEDSDAALLIDVNHTLTAPRPLPLKTC